MCVTSLKPKTTMVHPMNKNVKPMVIRFLIVVSLEGQEVSWPTVNIYLL